MFNCLKYLISPGDKCAEEGVKCAVYSFDNIPWYTDNRGASFSDSRYDNLSEWKAEMIRLASIKLGNDITSWLGSDLRLKDSTGYFNDYGHTELGCIKNTFSKGIRMSRRGNCSAVRLALNGFCLYHKPSAETISVVVLVDDANPINYTVSLDSSGITCINEICDSSGNPITAKNSISVYTNNDTVQFIKHDIPCQTGCGGITNDCAKAEGFNGSEKSTKSTYGIEVNVSCVCDFSDVVCNGIHREKLADLMKDRLEYEVADYAMCSDSTDMFKQSLEVITARMEKTAENYEEKLNKYLTPLYKDLANKTKYNKCVECTGISYGYN